MPVFFLLSFALSFLVLLIASFTDLKERIVPNTLTYGAMGLGLLLGIGYSLQSSDWNYLIAVFQSMGLAIVLAMTLHQLGVWAGGDVKLLVGLAALSPFNPALLNELNLLSEPLFMRFDWPVFSLSLLLFSVFAMLPYGILLSMHALAKKKELHTQTLERITRTLENALFAGLLTAGSLPVLNHFKWPIELTLVILIAWGFLPKLEHKAAIGILAALAGLALARTTILGDALAAFLVFGIVGLGWFFLEMSPKLLRETKKTMDLSEGDIPALTWIEHDAHISNWSPPSIKELIHTVQTKDLKTAIDSTRPKGRIVCDARMARGLEENELAEIKKLHATKNFPDEIEVKKTTAFVPAMLIGFVLLNIAGDAWIRLLLGL